MVLTPYCNKILTFSNYFRLSKFNRPIMKKLILLSLLLQGFAQMVFCQQSLSTQNVILVTFDGLRWQEVFSGADKSLITNSKFVSDTIDLKEQFWTDDPEQRRSMLMPFFPGFSAVRRKTRAGLLRSAWVPFHPAWQPDRERWP